MLLLEHATTTTMESIPALTKQNKRTRTGPVVLPWRGDFRPTTMDTILQEVNQWKRYGPKSRL